MKETNKTNTLLQMEDNNIPYYERYPTPMYDKKKNCRTYGGVLNEYDFSMEYLSMSMAADKINNSWKFDEKIGKLSKLF